MYTSTQNSSVEIQLSIQIPCVFVYNTKSMIQIQNPREWTKGCGELWSNFGTMTCWRKRKGKQKWKLGITEMSDPVRRFLTWVRRVGTGYLTQKCLCSNERGLQFDGILPKGTLYLLKCGFTWQLLLSWGDLPNSAAVSHNQKYDYVRTLWPSK